MVGVVYGGLGWLYRERDWGTSGGETRRFSSVRWWGIEDEVLLIDDDDDDDDGFW
jgi:hypothetical protein